MSPRRVNTNPPTPVPLPRAWGRTCGVWLKPVAVALGALGFGFMVLVGAMTFWAWLHAPIFQAGDCIVPDEPYERWQKPNQIRIIEEVGAQAYRYRSAYPPSSRGGAWSIVAGDDGLTMPFRYQSIYRRYPCPSSESDPGPAVDHLRPRGQRE